MSGPRPLVLVADDHEMMAKLLRRTLEAAGYSVVVESDAEGVADAVVRERPALAIVDVEMPPREPFHALSAIQSLPEGQRPLVISVSGDDRVREQALTKGAIAFVPKPWDPDDLLAAVERGLASGSPPG